MRGGRGKGTVEGPQSHFFWFCTLRRSSQRGKWQLRNVIPRVVKDDRTGARGPLTDLQHKVAQFAKRKFITGLRHHQFQSWPSKLEAPISVVSTPTAATPTAESGNIIKANSEEVALNSPVGDPFPALFPPCPHQELLYPFSQICQELPNTQYFGESITPFPDFIGRCTSDFDLISWKGSTDKTNSCGWAVAFSWKQPTSKLLC